MGNITDQNLTVTSQALWTDGICIIVSKHTVELLSMVHSLERGMNIDVFSLQYFHERMSTLKNNNISTTECAQRRLLFLPSYQKLVALYSCYQNSKINE